MGPEEQKENVLYYVGGDGAAVPLGEIGSLVMMEEVNPFGGTSWWGVDFTPNAFARLEVVEYFTAKDFRKLLKLHGIKRKILADRRRMESARRYRERKALKRTKKQVRRQ